MKIAGYRVKKILNMESLRELCIKNNYYTCGDNEAYSHMLEMPYYEDGNMRDVTDLIPDIASDIYNNSDTVKLAETYGCSQWQMLNIITEQLLSIAVDIPYTVPVFERENGDQITAQAIGDEWKIYYHHIALDHIGEPVNLMFDQNETVSSYTKFYSLEEACDYIEEYLDDFRLF